MFQLSANPQAQNSARIEIQTTSGLTLYAIIQQLTGAAWNAVSGAFETINPANWADYVVALNETIPTTGIYFGDPPAQETGSSGTGPGPGTRLLPIYQQQGSQPASTDPIYTPIADTDSASNGALLGRPLVFVLELSENSAIVSMGIFAPSGTGFGRALSLPARQDSLAIAQDILNRLYAARVQLATSSYASVAIDGQQVSFTNPQMLDDQIQFWERKCAVLSGKRRRTFTLRLDRW